MNFIPMNTPARKKKNGKIIIARVKCLSPPTDGFAGFNPRDINRATVIKFPIRNEKREIEMVNKYVPQFSFPLVC